MVRSASLGTSPFLDLDPFMQGLELRPEDLPDQVAQVLRTHQKELGDTVDSKDELRRLMQMLNQSGGDMNGLARPDFKGLNGMSAMDMLQMLIDWIQSGGPDANKKSQSVGQLRSPTNFQPTNTSWSPSGGSGNGGSGSGTSVAPSNSSTGAPMGGGSPMKVDAPPGTQLEADAPWISQMNSQLVERAGDDACYRACRAMMKAAGFDQPTNIDDRIQVATGEEKDGTVDVDLGKAQQATSFIDQQLKAGKPVTVGVSYKDADYNEGITDHFVVVTGKGVDDQGRVFYTYQDPGSEDGQNRKFLVDDKTGNLYDPSPTFGGRFELSMVVPANG